MLLEEDEKGPKNRYTMSILRYNIGEGVKRGAGGGAVNSRGGHQRRGGKAGAG